VPNTGTNKFGIDIYAIKVGIEGKVMLLNKKGQKKIKLIITFSCISNYTMVSMRDFWP
jgi:hypothetical protein